MEICDDEQIKSVYKDLEQLHVEHLISGYFDSINHIEQLKGNDTPDLFV